jgi:protein-tyrosine phosphatase
MIAIFDNLYLGDREAARDLRRLKEAGITHIVNCASELPNYHEGEFIYLPLMLFDPDPEYYLHLTAVCAFIDAARARGKVLVHCFASISRSPAIVLAYLCHLGDPLPHAAARLAKLVWTAPDRIFLEQLAEHLGEEWTEESLREVEYTLQGRPFFDHGPEQSF